MRPANPGGQPGVLHREIDRWLRANALGLDARRPRSELVAHLWAFAKQHGLRIIRDVEASPGKDFDRQVRALGREALVLYALPVLSTSAGGYYSGRPGVAHDWRQARHEARSRIVALVRADRALTHARERVEAQALTGRAPRQLELLQREVHA